jgi:hypothetical protein
MAVSVGKSETMWIKARYFLWMCSITRFSRIMDCSYAIESFGGSDMAYMPPIDFPDVTKLSFGSLRQINILLILMT